MNLTIQIRTLGIFLVVLSLGETCDYVKEMWHTPFSAKTQEHHSPTPPHNLMVVDQKATLAAEVQDTFAQEDQSTVDGSGGNDRVYTDRPLEEYLDSMVDNPDPKFQTYTTREGFQRRPLTREDVFGTQGEKGHGYYSIKLTNGMVFKTDQIQCDTAFEHPVSKFERGGSEDHTLYVDDGGGYEYSQSDGYCYFLILPSNGRLSSLVSRVHEDDENSRSQIKDGIAPYLRLEAADLAKLSSPESGDFKWVKGRYIAAMPEGKIAIPKNGTNLAHNRATVYRPYFQDVHRQSAGSTASAKLLATLGNTFPATRTNPGEDPPEFFPVNGLDSRAAGVQYEDPLQAREDEARYGSKLSSWGGLHGGQYLAIGPEDANPKRLNWALHFPSIGAEQEYLNQVGSGGLNVNSNRVDGDSRYGEKALAQGEVNEKLTPGVMFQLGAQGAYQLDDEDHVELDPMKIESNDETVNCDDDRIKPWCDKYRTFHQELVALYQGLGIAEIPGADDRFEQILASAPLDRALNVGGKTFFVSTPRITIGEFENRNKAFFDDLDVTIVGSDAERHEYNWILFMTREPTIGMDMDQRLVKLKAGLATDYERIATRNFGAENGFFSTKGAQIQGGCSGVETCNESGFKNLIDTRYLPFEKNRIISGGFLYYTSQNPDGRQLLSRLALLQNWTSHPPNSISWRNLLPQQLQSCSKGAMNPCYGFLDGSVAPPVKTNDEYKFLRFDPDKEPFIKLGI